MSIDPIKSKKLASVRAAMKNIHKTLKQDGVVSILGDKPKSEIERFDTGSILLNIALGGGLAKGRIVEFFGFESSGKTLIATRIAGEVQRQGGLVAFIDMEQSFDPSFAAKLGLNVDELIYSMPSSLQEAFNVIDELIESGAIDLLILDSVAALVPQEELDGEVGKQTIGLVARYMSQFLRRISPKLARSNCSIIFINQTRDQIGVMWGDPTTTPGGRALKFYSSIRVQVSKVGSSNVMVKKGKEELVAGYKLRCNVKKNKTAQPFRKCEIDVWLDGRTIDKVAELAEASILAGLFSKVGADGNPSKSGRTYLHAAEPQFKATSRSDVTEELRKYPDLQQVLIAQLDDGIEVDPDTTPDPDDEMDPDKFESIITNEAEESGWEEL